MAVPTFTGAALDRASMLRTDSDRMSALLGDGTATVVAATADRVLVNTTGGPSLRRVPLRDVSPYLDSSQPILLGLEAGAPLFAIDLEPLDDASRAEFAHGGELISLRRAGTVFPQPEGGLAAYLTAMLNWHRAHGFCAKCGAATAIIEGGASRRCPECGTLHFPRTDPVVIMLVEWGENLLLGRRAGWPDNTFSVLAGFVSPGETPEEAVIREVKEEADIDAYGPSYITSQPWPFPSSLMLGFGAKADGGTPRVVDRELEQVRWFTLDEVAAAARGDEEFSLPPRVSIARTLIDVWLDRIQS
jgi:NAD+ diphosphatase